MVALGDQDFIVQVTSASCFCQAFDEVRQLFLIRSTKKPKIYLASNARRSATVALLGVAVVSGILAITIGFSANTALLIVTGGLLVGVGLAVTRFCWIPLLIIIQLRKQSHAFYLNGRPGLHLQPWMERQALFGGIY